MKNLSREKFKNTFRIVVIVISLLFTSCLTLESKITFNNDGSGVINFNYRLNKGFSSISNLGDNGDIVPLNLSREYIENLTVGNEDISYKNYEISEDDKYQYISVDFDFKNIDALNTILPEGNRISLSVSGGRNSFSQVVSEETGEISEESLSIFNDLFREDYIEIVIETPSDIVNIQGGESENNRAIFKRSIPDFLSDSSEIAWSVTW